MAYNSKYTGAEIEAKLDNIVKVTAGDGIKIENGVISCTFSPAKYYTGSSEPAASTGNNGDLYLQIGG